MADFCTRCYYKLFGSYFGPDIDVFGLVEKYIGNMTDEEIGNNYISGFIPCEHCGLIAITKKKDKIMAKRWLDKGKTTDWEEYELSLPRLVLTEKIKEDE